MRVLPIVPLILLASCAPVTETRDLAPGQAEITAALAERVPGTPQMCIPDRPDNRMRAYGHNIVFKVGNEIYLNRTMGGCENAGTMGEIFLLDNGGSAGNLCRNTNIRVVSRGNGMFAGNCYLGDFTPYRERRD